jgi:hypothetical protein
VGEDTVVILIGALLESADFLHFDAGSPPCDGVAVADTQWLAYARGTIVNKGGPTYATVWTNALFTTEPPPAHAALVASNITQVHACWLKMEGDGDAVAQDDWDWYKSSVFIIVTGDFRVKD